MDVDKDSAQFCLHVRVCVCACARVCLCVLKVCEFSDYLQHGLTPQFIFGIITVLQDVSIAPLHLLNT